MAQRDKSISASLVKGEERKLIEYAKRFPRPQGLLISLIPTAPSAMRVVLSYPFRVSMSITTGSFAYYQFSGNGCFDPDITGAGSQPLAYDQWSALYLRYRCLASSITVDFATPTAASNPTQTIRTTVVPSASSTTFGSSVVAAAQPYAVDKYVNGVIPSSASRSVVTMETNVFLGVTKQAVVGDDTYAAVTGSTPSAQWVHHVCATTVDGASSATVYLTGKVEYLVDFYDRNLLSLSADIDAPTPRKRLNR